MEMATRAMKQKAEFTRSVKQGSAHYIATHSSCLTEVRKATAIPHYESRGFGWGDKGYYWRSTAVMCISFPIWKSTALSVFPVQ